MTAMELYIMAAPSHVDKQIVKKMLFRLLDICEWELGGMGGRA